MIDSNPETLHLAVLDKRHGWHPFTPMAAWCDSNHEPLFLERGMGVWIWDSCGRKYLDGNSSIWTNIHGHGHPKLIDAIHTQSNRSCHTSFLGFSNSLATLLAARLAGFFAGTPLQRVFFTDDGSTAIECACKMAIQCRQLRGEHQRLRFIAFDHAYHGDTLGAASLGGIATFNQRFSHWGLDPLRVNGLDTLMAMDEVSVKSINAVIIEPMIQGVNCMHLWPSGMLAGLRSWCDTHGVFLILDEVMTGFGRTGKMFACQHENVVPDFLCLAKGITGGTMPLAATLTTDAIFASFGAANTPDHVFAYGHSYCGNSLGCAAGLANLDIFADENVIANLPGKISHLASGLHALQNHFPNSITAVRQLGMIAAFDLASDYGLNGHSFCLTARKYGLLTRPILDTVVIMPPLCITFNEIDFLFTALAKTLQESDAL